LGFLEGGVSLPAKSPGWKPPLRRCISPKVAQPTQNFLGGGETPSPLSGGDKKRVLPKLSQGPTNFKFDPFEPHFFKNIKLLPFQEGAFKISLNNWGFKPPWEGWVFPGKNLKYLSIQFPWVFFTPFSFLAPLLKWAVQRLPPFGPI